MCWQARLKKSSRCFRRMSGRVLGLMLAVAAMPLNSAFGTVRAQTSSAPITRASALKNVRVLSIPGWVEALSEENNFRVLFPGAPQIDDEVASVKGFKLSNSAGKWTASCAHLGQPVGNDEASLRKLYQQSMDAMTHGKTYLLASGDVFLNGRLGVEFRIRGLSRISYTRAFVFGRRLYTISVTRKDPARAPHENPTDVQQFFDSFIYWD